MPFLKWEMGLNFPGGGFATCICRSGDKRARLGDNWEGEQPACLSSGWLEGGLVEGQRAVPRWLRPLLPLISAWIGRWTGASLSVHRILGRIGHLMAIVSISPKLFDRSDNFIIKKNNPQIKSLLKWITQMLFEFCDMMERKEGLWQWREGVFSFLSLATWDLPGLVGDTPDGRTVSSGRRWSVPRAGSKRALIRVCCGR